jgi:hypothetical protein
VDGFAHHLTFLVGEHALEAVGVDDLLALPGRHRSQIAHRRGDHAPSVGRKLAELPENLARLLLLLGRQMLPRLHAVKHAQLLLGGQIGEMLQPLPQHLLPFRRKPPESGIVLESAFLLGRWQVFVPPQPIPRVAAGLGIGLGSRLLWTCGLVRRRCMSLGWSISLRDGRRRNGQPDRKHDRREPSRSWIRPPHCSRSAECAAQYTSPSRIGYHILLQIQIVEQLEIGIHFVIGF